MRSREFYEGAIAALSELSIQIIESGSWKLSWKDLNARYETELAALPPDPRDEALAEAERALESKRAATWDAHYGHGLSAEYARQVGREIDAAIVKIKAVRG